MLAEPKTLLNFWVAGAVLLFFALLGAKAQTPASADRTMAAQAVSSRPGQEHLLRLYNTHTFERLEIVYRRGDQYIPDALAKLDYFLRDHSTGDVRHLDPRLYDILSRSHFNRWASRHGD